MRTGVYQIRNLKNDKVYIGSAANVEGFAHRWSTHKGQLNSGKHHSVLLQRACDKYGFHAFVFEVLLYCAPKDCLMYEQTYLDVYQPVYNICKHAGSQLGTKRTAVQRRRMSDAQKGRKASLETRKKMSIARQGLKHSQETKRKIRNSVKRGEGHPSTCLTEVGVVEIKSLLKQKIPHRVIASQFGVSKTCITDISTGKRWRYINDPS